MPSGSRLPELGPRGEGWVVLQLLLVAAIAACSFVGVYWPRSVESFVGVLGLLIVVAGALLFVLGVLSLGSSFTPLPRPRARTRLRQGGIFGLVRHPVYGGVIWIEPRSLSSCSQLSPRPKAGVLLRPRSTRMRIVSRASSVSRFGQKATPSCTLRSIDRAPA